MRKRDRIGAMAKESAVLVVIAGVLLILGAIALINLEGPPAAHRSEPVTAIPSPESPPPKSEAPPESKEPAAPAAETVAPVTEPAAPTIQPAVEPTAILVTGSDIDILKAKSLLVPVAGVSANQLRDTFGDGRSEGRMHEALDIMAPLGTPVVAVSDGMVMKLFQSAKGGTTIYQADPSGKYVYYYAHLMRYADGLIEGKPIKRGEIIGYVGDTGNAGAGNYHLHFAILKPTAPDKWSGGTSINPYHVIGK